MLDWYKWRHDWFLNFLSEQLACKDDNISVEIYVDLPGKLKGISTIPTNIITTNLRPDAVIVNASEKKIVLFELSVPFEANISDTHLRKVKRYENLILDIEQTGYRVFYYPLEVGSRGYIDNSNFGRLKSFFRESKSNVNIKFVKKTLSKMSIVASFIVFHSKFEDLWLEPNFVNLH